MRTVQAAGGAEVVPLDLYVRRLPSGTSHFLSQRVRQAYDELARPDRLLLSLAVLPLFLYAAWHGRWKWPAGAAGVAIGAAEIGRRRAGGSTVFPFACSLLAPVWILERAVCIWLAVGLRLTRGGVLYRGIILTRAATSVRELRRRHGSPSRQTQVMSV